MRIIELEPRPPASILLLGRSGTGKTTVLVFRLFAAWLSAYQHTHTHQHCVFVTASATLKEQVRVLAVHML
jgi:ABC-type Na+ transport system ATPase subunit NatA